MSSASTPVSNVASPSQPVARKNRVLTAAIAGALGLLLVYAAGFAEIAAVHDAAHDVRHSSALPCH
jgi:cobalt transporter subunit CbtB